MEKLAYSIEEVTEVAPLGRDKVYAAINAGKLKAKKEGRNTVILAEDLREYLRSLPDYEPQRLAAAE